MDTSGLYKLAKAAEIKRNIEKKKEEEEKKKRKRKRETQRRARAFIKLQANIKSSLQAKFKLLVYMSEKRKKSVTFQNSGIPEKQMT